MHPAQMLLGDIFKILCLKFARFLKTPVTIFTEHIFFGAMICSSKYFWNKIFPTTVFGRLDRSFQGTTNFVICED